MQLKLSYSSIYECLEWKIIPPVEVDSFSIAVVGLLLLLSINQLFVYFCLAPYLFSSKDSFSYSKQTPARKLEKAQQTKRNLVTTSVRYDVERESVWMLKSTFTHLMISHKKPTEMDRWAWAERVSERMENVSFTIWICFSLLSAIKACTWVLQHIICGVLMEWSASLFSFSLFCVLFIHSRWSSWRATTSLCVCLCALGICMSTCLPCLNWLFSLVNIAHTFTHTQSLCLCISTNVYVHYHKHFCTFNIRTLPYYYEWIYSLLFIHTHTFFYTF